MPEIKSISTSIRLPATWHEHLKKKAKEEHRSVSNYIKSVLGNKIAEEMDTTEYLLSSEANAKILYKSIDEVKKGDYVTFDSVEDLNKYVQNLSK